MLTRLAPLPLLVLAMAGCAVRPVHPSPTRLAPWTQSLRSRQPDDAFASVYRAGHRWLVFVGAVHDNEINSKTFRLIGQAFDSYRFKHVIVEGYPTSRGANPHDLLREAVEAATPAGFQPGGETVPAERGAIAQKAQIWGGEPDDSDVKAYAVAHGGGEADVLGFDVLRALPQWLRERQITTLADPRLSTLVDSELARQRLRLGIDPIILAGSKAWRAWYAMNSGHVLDDSFSIEEVGPLADGPYATNRIAAIIAQARDAHLHRLMIEKLNSGGSVLVVYGGSHLMMHRPALADAIGKPCYEGDDLRKSVSACR